MTEQNRFSGLMGGLNQGDTDQPAATAETKKIDKPAAKAKAKGKKPSATVEAKKADKPLPKYKDPNYSQIGIYLPNEVHRKMKIGAAIAGLEMSEIAAAGIELWLEKNVPNI